jgi:radical SAM protein with 4Fe4S-binding SPASM domain
MAEKSLPAALTKRTPLQDLIPLDTPYSVLLSPIDFCNIKCVFCPFHGKVKSDKRPPATMTFDLFKTIADQLAEFPSKLKTLVFCGRGEPTLHKKLPDMIAYAKEKGVAEQIRLTTNGFALSPELNRKLIDSGLDYIRISVPAINEQTCFEITGVKFNLSEYVDNIRNLFENKRKDMTVYCKITDVALAKESADKFYSMFDLLCDYMFIENIVPQIPRKLTSDEMRDIGMSSNEIRNVYKQDNVGSPVCERLFYHLTVNSSGNVFPCDLNENAANLLGSVRDTTLRQIWNGNRLKNIRLASLQGSIPHCAGCSVSLYDFSNELHRYADIISRRL